MVGAEVEFGRRADHPVRHVAVRLARGDRDALRQDGARKRHDDEVADLEVPLLQVLHLPDRVVVLVPGQVDLAVLQDDLA